MATSYGRLRPRSGAALQVGSLLNRYPRLSEQELANLIELMPYLPILDQALITADDQLAGKFAEFLRDHRAMLTAPQHPIALFTITAFLALVAISWAFS
ncbi:hypothetical protein KRR38_31685 [Novosphingobium sp. G106]|uniref:hypothetical protein n=1 Tax=Novosphingobium sp. G106 TaxID=2849500 RepID=UPI001C2D4653|nr:hypothetical protein [Novosphingobium sp. G106]MBV1692110.1 hypothetical protein [Novosphingobium sp. G106]